MRIHVVGAGFAGVEAAWRLAECGHPVNLYEMRPARTSPAHTTDFFAELVCSNSLKSKSPTSPAGQLKAEMMALGSIVLATALNHQVPAGEALGVDRDAFGQAMTTQLSSHPKIEVRRREVVPDDLNDWLKAGDYVILATGPLTSPEVSDWLAALTGRQHLYFYDAVSPTIEADSIDRSVAFSQSRYDKGGDDYLNCPFNKEEYERFVEELVRAERAPIHAFEAGGVRGPAEVDSGYALENLEGAFLEKIKYFAGCTPIEAIAEKGARSLAFGNFKPVGLTDPRTGRRPWAALQLRPENQELTLYSMVACQTRLKWGEQKRVFRMVPGLERAEFARFGVIHRNTYVDAPQCLDARLALKDIPNLIVAGQLSGVEGYVESAAMGLLVGVIVAHHLAQQPFNPPPRATAYGSLLSHLADPTEREFAPMNINWGLFPDPEPPTKDKGVRRTQKIQNAREGFEQWISELPISL